MKKLIYKGKEFDTIKSLADYAGIRACTLRYRIAKGWDLETAVETPVAEVLVKEVTYQGTTYPSLSALADALDLDSDVLSRRLSYGWSLEDAVTHPVRRKEKTISYQGKTYSSIAMFAKEAEVSKNILYHNLIREETLDAAIEKSRQATAKEPYVLWGKSYQSYSEIAQAYGIGVSALRNRIAQGFDLEDAVLKSLSGEPICFGGKQYAGISELSAEFLIQPITVYCRLRAGMTLEQALTRELLPPTHGNEIEYDGKLFPSHISLCREYGISYIRARQLQKTYPTLTFSEAADILIRLKRAVGMSEQEQLNYIPRCMINGKQYKYLKDLSKEIGVSTVAINSQMDKNHFGDLFDTLRYMQQKTVRQYAVEGKAVQRKELAKRGYNGLRIYRMKDQQIDVPLYPSLQGLDFETNCFDTLRIYKQYLQEAKQAAEQRVVEKPAKLVHGGNDDEQAWSEPFDPVLSM